MNNFTTNTYEMKRDISNFSKKISKGVKKDTQSSLWIWNMALEKVQVF